MTDPSSFDDVRNLREPEQRALLKHTRPVVRLWAAWALGLRLGRGVGPVMADALADEPLAGMRRHFIVLLTGAGELGAVRDLAVSDPDELVRATALRHLARAVATVELAAAPEVMKALEGGSQVEKQAVVEGLPNHLPPPVAARVRALVADPDRGLRGAAFDAVLASEPGPQDLVAALVDHLAVEPVVAMRHATLGALAARLGEAALLDLVVAPATTAQVAPFAPDIVAVCAARGVRCPWSVVDRLLDCLPVEAAPLAMRLLPDGGEAEARKPLLRRYVDSLTAPATATIPWYDLGDLVRSALALDRRPLDGDEDGLHAELAVWVARQRPDAVGRASDAHGLLPTDDDWADEDGCWDDARVTLAALDAHGQLPPRS